MTSASVRDVLKAVVPTAVYRPLLSRWRTRRVRWGTLRRLRPVSSVFGLDRGLCIDRYYIEAFLQSHSADIHGCVLEIGDPAYTVRFGGERVTHSAVLHSVAGNPDATFVGDLGTGEGVPEQAFDCMIVTQTLQFIYDMKAAVATCYRALKPQGTLLVTLPGISQISRYDMDRWGDYWRLTTLSGRRLFEEVFPPDHVAIHAYGNVLSATAFLQGISADELRQDELDWHDPDYELLIAIRAVKPGAPA